MEKFGKFQLLEVIGRGGMAEIFLAKPSDAVLSKLVALKRILPEFTEDPNFREMFQREGAIALSLRHQGIIAVHEMGMVDQRYYISMEYFPGKTLANVLNKIRMTKETIDPTDIAFVIMKIAEALHYIHNFGEYGVSSEIIHRDVSPHNIMLGFDGGVKLIDFGVAKDAAVEFTKADSLKGKVAYMSPEQVRGEVLTKQTDIFSLGIVFWELLMQKKLFAGDSIRDLTAKVLRCEIPPLTEHLPHVSAALLGICNRALAQSPKLRYQTAGEMAQALQEYIRLAGADNSQKRLANVACALFPEEVSRLRGLLRKYEGGPAPSGPPAEDRSHFGSAAIPLPPLKLEQFETQNRSKTQSQVLNRSLNQSFNRSFNQGLNLSELSLSQKTKSLVGPILIGSAIGMGGVFAFVKLIPSREVANVEEEVVVPQEVKRVEPVPVAAKIPESFPPPAVQQAPIQQPIAQQPIQQTQPPQPAVVKRIPKSKVKQVVAAPRPQPTPPARVKKPVAGVMRSKTSPKNVSRKPAAVPPTSQEYAFITILADPDTKILVNNKMVGQEITDEIKVPAGKAIVVKTIAKATGKTQTRTFNFKAASRNVIEMFGTGE